MEQLYRKDNSPSQKDTFKDNYPSWKDNCPFQKTSLEASLPERTLLRPSQKDCVYGTASRVTRFCSFATATTQKQGNPTKSLLLIWIFRVDLVNWLYTAGPVEVHYNKAAKSGLTFMVFTPK